MSLKTVSMLKKKLKKNLKGRSTGFLTMTNHKPTAPKSWRRKTTTSGVSLEY